MLIKNDLRICFFLVGFVALFGILMPGYAEKNMNQDNHLIWSAEKEPSEAENYIFCYDKTLGFSDIDFHPISGDGWEKFKSPAPNQTATLVVLPTIAIEDLTQALQELKRKTGFERVKIDVRES